MMQAAVTLIAINSDPFTPSSNSLGAQNSTPELFTLVHRSNWQVVPSLHSCSHLEHLLKASFKEVAIWKFLICSLENHAGSLSEALSRVSLNGLSCQLLYCCSYLHRVLAYEIQHIFLLSSYLVEERAAN